MAEKTQGQITVALTGIQIRILSQMADDVADRLRHHGAVDLGWDEDDEAEFGDLQRKIAELG